VVVGVLVLAAGWVGGSSWPAEALIECSFIIFHFENNRVGVPSWPRIKDSRGTKRSSCSVDNPYFMVELENLSSHESPTGRFLNEDLYVNAAAVKSLQKQCCQIMQFVSFSVHNFNQLLRTASYIIHHLTTLNVTCPMLP
jgi:hypothetical protein